VVEGIRLILKWKKSFGDKRDTALLASTADRLEEIAGLESAERHARFEREHNV